MNSRLFVIFFASLVLFISACKDQDEETDYNPNVKSSKEYVFAEDILFEIINVYLKGITDDEVLNSHYAYLDNCAIFYYPEDDRMVFDYGEVFRWCPDNKFRKGKFTVDFNGPFFSDGSTASFTFDSLFVDKDLVEAMMDSEFRGTDNQGKEQIGFQVTDGRITLEDTTQVSIIHFSCDYLLTWEEGQQSPSVHEDDMFSVTGSGSGTSLDNIEYSITIQDPLANYLDCFWVTRGTHLITVPSAKITEGTIDYITNDDCFYKVDLFFGDSYFYENLKY